MNGERDRGREEEEETQNKTDGGRCWNYTSRQVP